MRTSRSSCQNASKSHWLHNYKSEMPTRSCYLDGRYIPLVLGEVNEFRKHSLRLEIELGRNFELIRSHAKGIIQISDGMNIIRVVIETPSMSHSALVWIDTRVKTITFTDVRDTEVLEPRLDMIMREADKAIDNLLVSFFSHLKYTYHRDIAYVDIARDEWSRNCGEFYGFCNAFIIKQVIDYLDNRDFDPGDIRKLAGAIERRYSHLLNPYSKPEIEYCACYYPRRHYSRG